jgi:hypothetical protein
METGGSVLANNGEGLKKNGERGLAGDKALDQTCNLIPCHDTTQFYEKVNYFRERTTKVKDRI